MNPAIQIRHDRKRGCGFRKPGGLYLVADGPSMPCGRLPIPLDVRPTCHGGIKPTRSWTWINGTALAAQQQCRSGNECSHCPLGGAIGRVGLLWIGGKFYPTPDDWTREAMAQGVSRRIPAVPKDFKVGETVVFVAHRECIKNADGSFTPGVFHVFKPKAVEYVVHGTETDEEIEGLVKRGLTPVLLDPIIEEPAVVAAQ